MSWYPAYLTSKQELVDWAQEQRPDLTTGMIPDIVYKTADTMVWMWIAKEDVRVNYTGTVSGSADPSPGDINNFLWAASLFFGLEVLAMRGVIHYTHGGLQKTTIGQVAHEFMRQQPMFFLGRGGGGLDDVMPFRSFKQLGQQFANAWLKMYLRDTYNRTQAAPQVEHDETDRGYGWNAGSGFRDYANAQSSGLLNI